MSQPLFGGDVTFYQRLLKCSGYLDDVIDGEWGTNTSRADERFLTDAAELKSRHGEFDQRSERHIGGLHIKAQELARRFMKAASQGPHTVKIISGTRSYNEQNALFRQGRFGNPPPRVTNARGGESNHNFCIAFDIGLFDENGKYLTGATSAEVKAYEDVAEIARTEGLDWGGNWVSFRDIPHYQVRTEKKIAAVRNLFESGTPYI